MSDLTRTLAEAQRGNPAPADELLPLVYEELRRLAVRRMANEGEGHTLQPTALVHEAWLKLTAKADRDWNGRTHFFAAAAEAMRRILVDNARRKCAARHGGELHRVDVAEMDLAMPLPDDELLALDDALGKLMAFNERAAQVVKLSFFVGLTQEQTAQELGVSISTVERLWAFARTFLYREIQNGGTPTDKSKSP